MLYRNNVTKKVYQLVNVYTESAIPAPPVYHLESVDASGKFTGDSVFVPKGAFDGAFTKYQEPGPGGNTSSDPKEQ